MSLEGLRAWIAEVERKLGKRTRVFLALTVIAIGIAGASLYLAIDTRNDSVSESDVRALQEKLETRIDEVAASGATTAPTVPPVETQPAPAPQPEESKPKPEGGNQKQNNGNGSNGDSGTSGGASNGSTGNVPGGATGGAANSAQIQELLEQAKRRSNANE